MAKISLTDIKRGEKIYEYPDGNYIDKQEPMWKFWYWSSFMGVRECYSFHRMTVNEQIEFNKTQPKELQIDIKS